MTWQKPFIAKAAHIDDIQFKGHNEKCGCFLGLRVLYANNNSLLDAMYYRFVITNGEKIFRLHWFYG